MTCSNLSADISNISTNTRVLVVNSAQTVSSNLTIPSNVTLKFVTGGKITVSSGATLTINGPIEAPFTQIFDANYATSSWVKIGTQVVERPVEWFGAVGDGSYSGGTGTNDYAAFKEAIASCCVKSGGGKVTWDNSKVYYIDPNGNDSDHAIYLDRHTLPDGTNASGWKDYEVPYFWFAGRGKMGFDRFNTYANPHMSGFLWIRGEGDGVHITNSAPFNIPGGDRATFTGKIKIENCGLHGNGTANDGILVDFANHNNVFSDIYIARFNRNGFLYGGNMTFDNTHTGIKAVANEAWGIVADGNAHRFYSCIAEGNYLGGFLIGNHDYQTAWARISGTHTGANGVSVLTDSSKNWLDDANTDYVLRNLDSGVWGHITANTANTITATATLGGGSFSWDNGDAYEIYASGDLSQVNIISLIECASEYNRAPQIRIDSTNPFMYSWTSEVTLLDLYMEGQMNLADVGYSENSSNPAFIETKDSTGLHKVDLIWTGGMAWYHPSATYKEKYGLSIGAYMTGCTIGPLKISVSGDGNAVVGPFGGHTSGAKMFVTGINPSATKIFADGPALSAIDPTAWLYGNPPKLALIRGTNQQWSTYIGGSPYSLIFQNDTGETIPMTLTTGGDLTVTGSVSATSCCDFVFEPGYALPSIEDVRESIETTKKLPGLSKPDMVDMKDLMVKTEEQALYILQLHDRLEKLEQALLNKE
jgi:hypothetical protein